MFPDRDFQPSYNGFPHRLNETLLAGNLQLIAVLPLF